MESKGLRACIFGQGMRAASIARAKLLAAPFADSGGQPNLALYYTAGRNRRGAGRLREAQVRSHWASHRGDRIR